jgi:hypothetical protein
MELKNKLLFLRGHADALEARVQVVDPAKPAALPSPIEAYTWSKEHRKKTKPNWLNQKEETYLDLDVRLCGLYRAHFFHPPPLKPDTFAKKSQRRSPNKRTNHTSWRSSCSVHGPFLTSPFCVTIDQF